jgi:hypothetical protein
MTPGQARIALSTFLLVTAGVAFNALFLQGRPSAASRPERPIAQKGTPDAARKKGEAARGDKAGPRWPGSSSADTPLRIARFAPDTARIDGAPEAAQDAASTKSVAAIQRELDARGYGPLASDGVIGIGTRAAIMAYEHDHGLALTGEASEALLEVFKEEDLPSNSYYGDGTRIETSVLDEIREAFRQSSVSFPWQTGDVLMLENMLIAHGRTPFSGPRKIIVAMADPFSVDQQITCN